jgi:hypothetical protein
MIRLSRIRSHFDSPLDVLWFAQIAVLITVLPVMLRTMSLPSVLRRLTPRHSPRVGYVPDKEKIARYTDWILRHRLGGYQPNCLKRSLVLYHFLRKSGLEVDIHLGLRRLNDRFAIELNQQSIDFQGHAWLTANGHVLLERHDPIQTPFQETYRYPN